MRWLSMLTWVLLCTREAGAVGGFHHFKAGSLFEGMLPPFGVKVNPDAFSKGFDIERCELGYSAVHDALHRAFKAFEFGDSQAVKGGLQEVSTALRLMASAAKRCSLSVVSAKLGEAGDDLAIFVSDEVSGSSTEGGLTKALLNGHNITDPLLKATRMWYKKDYGSCGKELANMVVALVGAVEEKDPHAHIRTMDDYWKQMQSYASTVQQAQQQMRNTAT